MKNTLNSKLATLLCLAIFLINSGCVSTLEKQSRVPSSELGNKVFLVNEAEMALRVRWDLLDMENEEIFADFHVWDSNGAGGYSIAKLCSKAQQGVRVRLVVDGIAMALWGNEFIEGGLIRAIKETCTYQGREMMSIRFWNPVEANALPTLVAGKKSHRNHDKILYLKGLQTVYEGDRNWQNVNYRMDPNQPGYSYFSVDAVVTGPVVNETAAYLETIWELAKEFEPKLVTVADKTVTRHRSGGGPPDTTVSPLLRKEYYQNTYDRKLADLQSKLKDIESGQLEFISAEKYEPIDWRAKAIPVKSARFLHFDAKAKLEGGDDSFNKELADLFASAQQKIFFATPFLMLPEQFHSALEDRARNGVEISLLTSAPNTRMGTVPKFYQFQNADINRLRKIGTKIYQNTGTDAEHLKCIMIDRKKTFLGTHNMNPRSVDVDLESGFLFEDETLTMDLEAFVLANSEDYKKKKTVTHFLLSPIVKPLLRLKFLKRQF
ncbi:MAG: phosphatidylserine/phosphatidylglycerophosphate/cardiolipin synthase family protein [Bdellovibrionota bacterium]